MGLITGLTFRSLKKYILKGYALKGALVAAYFFNIIIPSINSGGIFMLISLPALIYISIVYLVLKNILKRRIYGL